MKELAFKWLLLLLAFIAPVQAAAVAVFILVVADLVTGILSARAQNIKITSSGLKRSVTKWLAYEAALYLAFLTETNVTGHSIPLLHAVSGLIALTELASVLENLKVFTGIDMAAKVRGFLQSKDIKP